MLIASSQNKGNCRGRRRTEAIGNRTGNGAACSEETCAKEKARSEETRKEEKAFSEKEETHHEESQARCTQTPGKSQAWPTADVPGQDHRPDACRFAEADQHQGQRQGSNARRVSAQRHHTRYRYLNSG